ncbi:MAG: methyltransferase [Actinophytocola sp.]|uniref:methyltransferase n=1 Tax=Actinophytocola sp. TaxID=1872138 RepID=UPI003C7232C8
MADKEMHTHDPATSLPVKADRTVDAPSVVSAYDWGALGHVVDVGGGDGTLLIALLNEYPALSGTVVDLPPTADAARKRLDAAGLAERAGAVAGDFLGELPEGAEGYLLSSVLHEWGDDDARAILRNCASAAGEDGAVFVIEPVPDGAVPSGVASVSGAAVVDGAVGAGAWDGASPPSSSDRGVAELSALAESAGLVVAAVHTAGTVAIVELATG